MIFRFCPQCKSDKISYSRKKKYSCSKCGWVYFQNVAAAVGVIFEYQDKILFIVRNKIPQKGKLDLPGGFLDAGESAEQAARREIREELDIELKNLRYLGSYPNKYDYGGITYITCDIIFISQISELPDNFNEEIAAIKLLKISEVDLAQIAFDSVKMAISDYIKGRQNHPAM
jgi:NAD+ diphosphatase